MSVGILIITHSNIGKSLCDAVVSVLGTSPLTVKTLPVSLDCDPEQLVAQAHTIIKTLDQGDGVLVLTDMYGSTPSNIACKLSNTMVKVVAGVNLPMLVRIMNYPKLDLQQLTDKAVSGGHEGVIPCSPAKH
ncbi:MAG: PTS sugar transporter subunit IIA [Gammaproteobacteria bacterium]|nr:PTS sugar transporter subunit IIA [Gammaproteobacteria bacterium]MDH5777732.1 PTS sugar transporter subunit IIA [Gammaproteobacteria bacterium]